MSKIENYFFLTLKIIMVLLLAAMTVMVFSNVVLRYFFNSGWNESEELARFMFIWLTFIGAVVAVREGAHLGVDMVLQILPRRLKFAATVLSHVLMIGCCGVLFWGLWAQHEINMSNAALMTGIPLGVVYGVGFFCALGMGTILLVRVVRLFTGRITVEELIQESESTQGAE